MIVARNESVNLKTAIRISQMNDSPVTIPGPPVIPHQPDIKITRRLRTIRSDQRAESIRSRHIRQAVN